MSSSMLRPGLNIQVTLLPLPTEYLDCWCAPLSLLCSARYVVDGDALASCLDVPRAAAPRARCGPGEGPGSGVGQLGRRLGRHL